MKPGETIRFACEECHVVFDLGLAPIGEWAEMSEDPDDDGATEATCCAFCGSHEIKALHDRPVTALPGKA